MITELQMELLKVALDMNVTVRHNHVKIVPIIFLLHFRGSKGSNPRK